MNTEYLTLLKEYVVKHMSYGFGRLPEERQAFINALSGEDSSAGARIRSFFEGAPESISREELSDCDKTFLVGIKDLTKKKVTPEAEYQISLWDLDEREAFVFRMACAFFVFEDMTMAASVFADDRTVTYLTPGLLELCSGSDAYMEDWYKILGSGSRLSTFILDTDSLGERDIPGEVSATFSGRRIALDRRMEAVVMGDHRFPLTYGKVLKASFPGSANETFIGKFDDTLFKWMSGKMEDDAASSGALLCVYGRIGSGRRTLIRHTAKKLGLGLGFVNAEALADSIEETGNAGREKKLAGIIRELILFSLMPVVITDCRDRDRSEAVKRLAEDIIEHVRRFFPMVIILVDEKMTFDLDGIAYLERPDLTLLEAKEFWEQSSKGYKFSDKDIIGSMANRFTLTPGKIVKSLEMAGLQAQMEGKKKISGEILNDACYQVLEQKMGDKAVYVPAKYTMDDLILAPRQKKKLKDICDLVRYKYRVLEEWGMDGKMSYGRGISAAFIGAPGTGKTMAAQVLAKELGLRLYKVNLSGVVSKYVGETEKRLNEIFDEAEKSQVILFFDEADVLFGKRSEVKDSNDKYSNMEVAFLLQKMENYNGITIIATNLFQHFDEAFKRRLKSVVEFSLPDEATRKTLWQSMIPDKLPTEEVDFDYLASHFELSGSNIRNIIFQAAFYAAAKDKAMGMEEIIPAVANEYSKLGKTISREDVDEYYMYLEG